jgi:hypothetical protein
MLARTLVDVLDRAQALSPRPELGGMASVKLEYNPYENRWEAEANWSSNVRIRGKGHADPERALILLYQKLMDYLESEAEKPEPKRETEDGDKANVHQGTVGESARACGDGDYQEEEDGLLDLERSASLPTVPDHGDQR